MREEIRRIHARTRITTIYVTHDQKEALSLADRMAVMRDGVVEQLGDPRAIYRSPANRFVADFIGETNWLPAEVQRRSDDEVIVKTDFGEFHAPLDAKLSVKQKVWMGFRPEAVEMGSDRHNSLETTIAHVSYLGEVEQYELRLSPSATIKAVEQNPQQIRRVGQPLAVHVSPQNLLLIHSA
jgi:ABC-type Fe3+/spermidine/putrescine transport system ATPase subunit